MWWDLLGNLHFWLVVGEHLPKVSVRLDPKFTNKNGRKYTPTHSRVSSTLVHPGKLTAGTWQSPFFEKKNIWTKPPWLWCPKNVNFPGRTTKQTAWPLIWCSPLWGFLFVDIIHQYHGHLGIIDFQDFWRGQGATLGKRIFRGNSYCKEHRFQEFPFDCWFALFGWAGVIVAGFLSFRCIIIKRKYTLRVWTTLHQKWWVFIPFCSKLHFTEIKGMVKCLPFSNSSYTFLKGMYPYIYIYVFKLPYKKMSPFFPL